MNLRNNPLTRAYQQLSASDQWIAASTGAALLLNYGIQRLARNPASTSSPVTSTLLEGLLAIPTMFALSRVVNARQRQPAFAALPVEESTPQIIQHSGIGR